MARRVYTGLRPVVFMALGRVTPGQEIEVPEEMLAGFDRRPDITVPRKRKTKAADGGGPDSGRQDQEQADPATRGD